jgi:sulfite dehydrogenase (quinone) subunit SoeC
MHPAPSVILFTVLSGLGFGCLAFLGLGLPAPAGWQAFLHWGLGYGLAVGGLIASTFHLGNPQRALLAFTQWRSSWLSREAWAAVAALVVLAPVALSDWLGLDWPRLLGVVGAVLCVATVGITSMIYTQMKSVPRWNHWITPVLFLAFMATGGAVLTGNGLIGAEFAVVLAVALIAAFRIGDGRFAAAAQTIGSATGLDRIGAVSLFELPHTGQNYLLREMIFVVARKHAAKLRGIAVLASAVLPVVMLLVLPVHPVSFAGVAVVHLLGALAARWLFFAEAEHVVGLYYGKR